MLGNTIFCITATYDGIKIKSAQIKLTINRYILDGGSVQLNDVYGNAGRDNNSWKLSLDGKQITQGINWKIEDNNGEAVNGISVNGGIVSWSGNIATGEYSFYVTAKYDGAKIKSLLIKLNISWYILSGGSTQLSGTQGQAGSDDKPWQLSIDGKIITDNIDWAIEDFFYKVPIVDISINKGIVSWSGNIIATGEYYFFVIATYNGGVIASPLIKLTIN